MTGKKDLRKLKTVQKQPLKRVQRKWTKQETVTALNYLIGTLADGREIEVKMMK